MNLVLKYTLVRGELKLAKILLVDDDTDVLNLIEAYCELDGHTCSKATDGAIGLQVLKDNNYNFDLVITDVSMPNLDGFDMVKEVRKNSDVKVIFLTAKTEEHDKLLGFAIGSDDFVEKPFSPRELMARVNAILRRAGNNASDIKLIIEIDGIHINKETREVIINDKQKNLTLKEYELLIYLIENEKKALSREQILEKVWGYEYFGDSRTVDTHIKLLRDYLGKNRDYIKTVWGVGYKFDTKINK